MIKINYFASGKIYQNSDSGQIVTGHFSTGLQSNQEGDVNDLIEAVSERVSAEFGCDYKQVHIETLSKL